MTQRLRSDMYSNISHSDLKTKKMGNDLGTGKSVFVLVIVIGCFAVLCPNVFYPMLFGSPQNHIKPSSIDRTTGCCDVISETDVNTIRLMSELCSTIIKAKNETRLSSYEIINHCQKAILETCGIDISAVLQERVILGHSTKQILDEIRSLNGSLCLKYNFGVSPWRLGVPHRVTVKVEPSPSIKQERPPHLRSEMLHPAFKERGRAIPAQQYSPSRPPPRIVKGRPGPIPGMRPTMGGAGKVVPPPKQTTGTMGLIMPVYTTGIVILFTYTVMKVLFKKQHSESLYPPVEPDPIFRREVFEANRGHSSAYVREHPSNKLVVNAMSALLDQVDKELASRIQTSDTQEDITANGKVVGQEDQGSVKVLGMEMTASCEGNKKWSGSDSPVLPSTPTNHPTPTQPPQPPHEIYLQGSLPPQSNHLLVADSATETQNVTTEEDPAVVLAGKMTLSVLSLDSENGTEELHSNKKLEERSSSNVSEDFEKIDSGELLEEPLNEVSSFENENVNKARNDVPATVANDLQESSDHEVFSTNNAKIAVTIDTNYSTNSNLEKLETTITDITDLSGTVDDIENQSNVCVEEHMDAKEVVKNIDGSAQNDLSGNQLEDLQVIRDTVGKIVEEDRNNTDEIANQLMSISNDEESQNQFQIISDEKTLDTNSTNTHIANNETEKLSNSSIERAPDISEPLETQPEIIEIECERKNDETSLTTVNNLIIEHSNNVGTSASARIEPYDDSPSNDFEHVNDADGNAENNDSENEEYEYDISDDADTDEEIQNVERFDNIGEGGNTRMNGADLEQLKDDTYEDNLGSDEEVEEIIEYVTDEEEQEHSEDEIQHHNNVNNLGHNFPDVN